MLQVFKPIAYRSNIKSKQMVTPLFIAYFVKRTKSKKAENKFLINIRLLQMKVSVSNSVVYGYFF